MNVHRRGTTLVELLVALGIATGLFATMATVEFVARRATFDQIAILDSLDALDRPAHRPFFFPPSTALSAPMKILRNQNSCSAYPMP